MELTGRILLFLLSSLAYSGLSQDLPKATVTVESPEEPFYPGDSVTLRCDITEYTDWEYYHWYRDNTHIPSKTSKTITISLPTESGQYVCSGQRKTFPPYSASSRAVTVSYQDLPKATVTVKSPEEPFYPGDTVTLRCYITQYTDWEYYYWYRDNTHIPSKTSKTITISLPTESGQYDCSGWRRTRPQYSYSSQAVTVSYQADLPTPALTVDPQSPVFTGEKVTLKCEMEPSSGWRYKWYKEQSSNVVFQSEGNTFIITAASGSDEGRYWCRGEREHSNTNTPKSRDVYLYVKAPPTATLTVAPQSPVWTGDTVTLRCEVASLTGWRYKWYKGRSQTAVSQSDRYNRTGDTLTIRGAAESDQDQYWCQGERDTRPTSSLISTHLTLAVKGSRVYDLSLGVWVGLGVGVIFIILLSLLCCLRQFRGRCLCPAEGGQKMRKQSPNQDQRFSEGNEEAQTGYETLQSGSAHYYDAINPVNGEAGESGTGQETNSEDKMMQMREKKKAGENLKPDTVYSLLQITDNSKLIMVTDADVEGTKLAFKNKDLTPPDLALEP
ncbi:Fc receptor-like protein 6 isoform X2 [Denticeps clupeoides]|uniref:Fc receptor-like protein 6 isoform X2 n=1 Tax=Denticeps clupeoides TaxID=299321 RepID=UPI0010A499C1|nr:Fc receptor-like protein 6 isoform X2 [Denticeps clupeoides]